MLPSLLAGFAGYDAPRAVFPSIVDVCGDSTGAVLGQGDMPVVVASGAFGQTARITVDIPQLQFLVKVVMISCRAEADSHCLAVQQTFVIPLLVRVVLVFPCRSHARCVQRQVPGYVSQLQFITKVVHTPVVAQSLIPMAWQTIEIHQLLVDTVGRCPFCAGRTGSQVQVVGGTVVLPQFLFVEMVRWLEVGWGGSPPYFISHSDAYHTAPAHLFFAFCCLLFGLHVLISMVFCRHGICVDETSVRHVWCSWVDSRGFTKHVDSHITAVYAESQDEDANVMTLETLAAHWNLKSS